jgi:predicted metal-dependent phosphoesterase TrpH
MPARSPFTQLCQQTAARRGRADLHTHSTCSDGAYTPAEVVGLARRSGLAALAITDHDTLAAVLPARAAAAGTGVEVISAVEITAEHAGCELHLLAYFVDPNCGPLQDALATLRHSRQERFHEMLARLRQLGIVLEIGADENAPAALGRRNLAQLLVDAGKAATIREAFARYLGERGPVVVPKKRLPSAEALALVRQAGGVSSWAHPSDACTAASLEELHRLGLGAIEVEYPDLRRSRRLELRALAERIGLAVTGGSDCHGPGKRAVGCCTISDPELAHLRQRAALTQALA